MTTRAWISFALLLSGCESAGGAVAGPSWQAPVDGAKGVSSGSEAERYFPLKDGTLYHYKTQALGDAPALPGALIVNVHRQSATRGELRRPTGNQSFELTAAGVATTTKAGAPAFLLKLPLEASTSWLGPHGGKSRISAAGVSVTVPAGSFSGCLTTLEERGGDAPFRILTTLCPDVGIVVLEVQSGPSVERAELVYYGPPIDIGADGVKRVE